MTMHHLRELAPALDGGRHATAWQVAQEIGVADMHVVVKGTRHILGTLSVSEAEGPDAHLLVIQGLSVQSGGLIYTPDSLYIESEQIPGFYYQVTLG